MLTEARWAKEQELMRSVFPEFEAFRRESRFGFLGRVRGPHSGQIYAVRMEADELTYPQVPPAIVMEPALGIHWIGEGAGRRLCVERQWRPARSTFANTLLTLIRYVAEHDPLPAGHREEPPPERGRRADPDNFWAAVWPWRRGMF